MGLEITNALGVGAIQPNIYVNPNRYITFGHEITADKFESTSLERYISEAYIQKMINSNPKIKKMVKDFNPDLKLNIKELNDLKQNHMKDTQEIVKGITDNLPFSLKNRVDIKSVENASYLHDIGKVLIPAEILNKPDKLTELESEIMHKHSELGYELLKTTKLDEKTLNLIRNHHQNAKKTGYPWVNKDFNADINLQILSAADKYSALTEKRTYKKEMSPKQALTIIYQDVKDGKLHPFVFKALVNYINNNKTAVQSLS